MIWERREPANVLGDAVSYLCLPGFVEESWHLFSVLLDTGKFQCTQNQNVTRRNSKPKCGKPSFILGKVFHFLIPGWLAVPLSVGLYQQLAVAHTSAQRYGHTDMGLRTGLVSPV